jgi:AcrR family transcriptional regulator
MARRKLSETSHPDESLTDSHWLSFGPESQPSMRLKILYVTFEEVAKAGPASFNVASVCDRLGVTYPMVNHYFGTRDSLIAEAAHMVYLRYVERLWEAVGTAPRIPEERFAAWIRAEIRETEDMGGWGSILNYPLAAREVSSEIYKSFGELMNSAFELNLARLSSLISDVRSGEVREPDYSLGKIPRLALFTDPVLRALVPTVSWAALGVSVWVSGQHLPSRSIPEIAPVRGVLIDNHIELMVTLIKNYRE